ncbi:ChaN family lipoprotein [Leptospira paudalimensis]|uniref:ChaN family lipoprotein n=1 Tax=Leptospira paudalimensis TaxID=2950024 RepID=A0ABT3M9S7_9LEPT|nr:ChaN family lipoprotein [Leptospira paudalimensis]MCW7505123.1 ChaN family lipoprotein [Leptospira paudalimensis]
MKVFYKRTFSCFLYSFFVFGLFGQTSPNNLNIIRTKTSESVSLDDIIRETKQYDVIVLGEEHDNQELHRFYEGFLRKLYAIEVVSLSLEMLEKDQQFIVDEYLNGTISESQFLTSIVHWKNFKTDYLPLVNLTKEYQCKVVAANPPRRYVNLISKKGLLAYRDFSPTALTFLPQAYTLEKYLTKEYKQRLTDLFGGIEHSNQHKTNLQYMILGQATWDQGMAEAISSEIHKSGKKVVHLNGRFHSDRNGGVVSRLREMGHSVLVLSGFPKGKEEESDFVKIADFVILTNDR